jgi:hypothetical protein
MSAPEISIIHSFQFGSSGYDSARAIGISKEGDLYLAGYTVGGFGGAPSSGTDGFVTKIDKSNQVIWSQLISGSGAYERVDDLALDSMGFLYVCGISSGSFLEDNNIPYGAFIAKYTPGGDRVWVGQASGTQVAGSVATALALDELGHVYSVGATYSGGVISKYSGFISKHNNNGELIWSKELGYSGDSNGGVRIALDPAGNVYVTGFASGGVYEAQGQGSRDAFVSKYSPAGDRLWTRVIGGESQDEAWGVAVGDDESVYIIGKTYGNLAAQNSGNSDIFLAKINAFGETAWITQFGSSGYDEANDVTVDSAGFVYITGYTSGDIDGQDVASRGTGDSFLIVFDPSGSENNLASAAAGRNFGI